MVETWAERFFEGKKMRYPQVMSKLRDDSTYRTLKEEWNKCNEKITRLKKRFEKSSSKTLMLPTLWLGDKQFLLELSEPLILEKIVLGIARKDNKFYNTMVLPPKLFTEIYSSQVNEMAPSLDSFLGVHKTFRSANELRSQIIILNNTHNCFHRVVLDKVNELLSKSKFKKA